MFITIDGPDGTGKTTAAHNLVDILKHDYHLPVVYTSEPTDGETGREIRRILKTGGVKTEKLTELFVKDRAEHVSTFLLPQQEQGNIVLCDRYKYSTICYQSLQGEPIESIAQKNAAFPAPDIAFILYAENEDILLQRILKRGQMREVFETRSMLAQANQIYQRMECWCPEETFVFLDAGRQAQEVLDDLLRTVLEKLNLTRV